MYKDSTDTTFICAKSRACASVMYEEIAFLYVDVICKDIRNRGFWVFSLGKVEEYFKSSSCSHRYFLIDLPWGFIVIGLLFLLSYPPWSADSEFGGQIDGIRVRTGSLPIKSVCVEVGSRA